MPKKLKIHLQQKKLVDKSEVEKTKAESLSQLDSLLKKVNLVSISLELPDPWRIFYRKLHANRRKGYEKYSAMLLGASEKWIIEEPEDLLDEDQNLSILSTGSSLSALQIKADEVTSLQEAWTEILREIQPYEELLKYIYSVKMPFTPLDNYVWIYRYSEYYDVWKKMKSIVSTAMLNSAQTAVRSEGFTIENYPARLKINSKGKPVLDEPIFEIWQNINLWQLRSCLVCEVIYLPSDKRQKYCSEKCRNIKNARDLYADPKRRATLLQNRIDKRRANKPLSEAEKTKHRERQEWNSLDFSKKV